MRINGIDVAKLREVAQAEDTLRPSVNTELQPGLTYNMICALHSQSPPSFLALSCLTR